MLNFNFQDFSDLHSFSRTLQF